jgi:hypothetical protein
LLDMMGVTPVAYLDFMGCNTTSDELFFSILSNSIGTNDI